MPGGSDPIRARRMHDRLMTVYFTADTHFSHKAIVRLNDRPYENRDAMDAALIANWNATVGPEDLVYHLGDFCFKGSAIADRISAQLNGEIVLVRGNHDTANTVALPRWRETADLLEVSVEGVRLALCHYPLLEWPGAYKGVVHLHGHTHGRVPGNRQRADVGVDLWDFRPVSLPEIQAKLAESEPYDPTSFYAPGA